MRKKEARATLLPALLTLFGRLFIEIVECNDLLPFPADRESPALSRPSCLFISSISLLLFRTFLFAEKRAIYTRKLKWTSVLACCFVWFCPFFFHLVPFPNSQRVCPGLLHACGARASMLSFIASARGVPKCALLWAGES